MDSGVKKTVYALDHYLLTTEYAQEKRRLIADLNTMDFCSARERLERLKDFHQGIVLLEQLQSGQRFYIISTWLLHDSYRLLMKSPVESVHYVAGVQVGRVFIALKIVGFELEHQSAVGAKAEVISSFQALRQMDRYGNKFILHVHSHPGVGKHANHPSGTDHDYQERLEKGGYRAVGCIFSRDGWFRFFANGIPVTISLAGSKKGVIRDDGAWRLIET